ncbi:MAG: response regulator [Bacteroidota bacterium]
MSNRIKILILEDNKSDLALLQRELKKSGLFFSSEHVQTRQEFEYALDNFKPNIILSDYSLPSFDGVTAFHIKQRKHSEIPFIIVSGTIGEENAVELIKNGINDYALKDKLFSLVPKITRALKDADEIKAKRIAGDKLKLQNEKLLEIAFLQSHQMRVPVVHILGLYDFFNFNDPADPINAETLSMLKISAESLDNIIGEIVQKISDIDAL